jgi:DNA (cytosine-5)-methyltransferase 1
MCAVSLNVLDIFCGAGGMSTGFKEAGFNIKYAIDKSEDALKTFSLNHPNSKILKEDVRVIDYSRLEDIDIIIGGFPCTAFSNANRKRIVDHPDKLLFKEYLRAIKEIRPKLFVMENVNGIINEDKDGRTVLKDIIVNTKSLGYLVNYWLVNMAYWGLPQKRERVIVIGSRVGEVIINNYHIDNNLGLVTVDEAIADLESIEPTNNKSLKDGLPYNSSPKSEYQKARRKECTYLYNHTKINHGLNFIEKVSCIPQGGNWRHIPTKLVSKSISRHYNSYRRLEYANQSITVVNVRKSCILHPIKNRVLTAREAARLQGFDDDYIFVGTKDGVYQQIANAVSPIVAKHIAEDILKGNVL